MNVRIYWLIMQISTTGVQHPCATYCICLYSWNMSWFVIMDNIMRKEHPQFKGILPKGPYPPCLRMADRALLAGNARIKVILKGRFILCMRLLSQIRYVRNAFCSILKANCYDIYGIYMRWRRTYMSLLFSYRHAYGKIYFITYSFLISWVLLLILQLF